jgi:mannitol-1-phosphate/altronate dehydrogenase
MPYYRIVIWVHEEKVKKGIKYLKESNIAVVQNVLTYKARKLYGYKFEGLEVQMLAKSTAAVQQYIREEMKRKGLIEDMSELPPDDGIPVPKSPSRKEYRPSPGKSK